MVILDSLVSLGVPVRGLDEALPLALKNLLGSSDSGIDKSGNLKTGTEFVLESERVAGGQPNTRSPSLRRLTSMAPHPNRT